MKKLLVIAVVAMFTGGCKSTQVSGVDDVYANPSEEKALVKQAAAEKAAKEVAERKQAEEQAAARASERAKEASKPEYKDPEYNADDYYDYEYAARINRFHQPLYGAGYYDPYYTNLYTYNQNPYFYGTSIYSSSMWMPSMAFNNLSFGISSGWGYGYSGFWNGYYNPYNSFYSPWYSGYGYGYSPWGYDPWGYNNFYSGYNMGYYNGYNAGSWGYLNKLDPNSGYNQPVFAPRGGSTGGNSGTRTSAGMAMPSESRQKYFEAVKEEQGNTPRFTAIDQRANANQMQNNSARPAGGNVSPVPNTPVNADPRGRRESEGRQGDNTRVRRNSNRVDRNAEPQPQQQQQNRPAPVITQPAPVNPGGGMSPRHSGGNNTRPR